MTWCRYGGVTLQRRIRDQQRTDGADDAANASGRSCRRVLKRRVTRDVRVVRRDLESEVRNSAEESKGAGSERRESNDGLRPRRLGLTSRRVGQRSPALVKERGIGNMYIASRTTKPRAFAIYP